MDSPSRPADAAQSFIIRLWQERPRQWRGTVRHVQSDAQRGFNKLDQAVSFIEQRANAAQNPAVPAQPKIEAAPSPVVDLSWLTARRLRPVFAIAGLVALVILALLFVNPNSEAQLSGAAVTLDATWQLVSAFVIGAVLGGIGVGWWLGRTR